MVKKLINNKNIKDIEILTKRKTKIDKCPICACNNCIIKIVNYRLHFSNCCKKHKDIRLFEEYDDTQTINYQKIKCDNQCGKTQKDCLEEFHKCLDCTNLAGYAIYYCNDCNNIHQKKHKTISSLASPSAGTPALKYRDVNTETPSPGEVKGFIYFITKINFFSY